MPPDTGVLRSRRARGYEGTLRRMQCVLSRICATSIKAILYEVTFTLNCKCLFVIKAYKPYYTALLRPTEHHYTL